MYICQYAYKKIIFSKILRKYSILIQTILNFYDETINIVRSSPCVPHRLWR